MLHRIFLSVLCLVLVSAPLSAQITSTLSAETGNNTSAAGPYNSTTGNASPGNVSKLPCVRCSTRGRLRKSTPISSPGSA